MKIAGILNESAKTLTIVDQADANKYMKLFSKDVDFETKDYLGFVSTQNDKLNFNDKAISQLARDIIDNAVDERLIDAGGEDVHTKFKIPNESLFNRVSVSEFENMFNSKKGELINLVSNGSTVPDAIIALLNSGDVSLPIEVPVSSSEFKKMIEIVRDEKIT